MEVKDIIKIGSTDDGLKKIELASQLIRNANHFLERMLYVDNLEYGDLESFHAAFMLAIETKLNKLKGFKYSQTSKIGKETKYRINYLTALHQKLKESKDILIFS